MATQQNIGTTAHLPLVPSVRSLFDNAFDECGIMRPDLLPFVRFEDGEVTSYWSVPTFPAHQTNDAASAFGRRAAAAYAVSVAHKGSEAVSLQDIFYAPEFQRAMTDHPSDRPGSRQAALAFCLHLNRLMWSLGQMVSPAQIAADAEAAIAWDRSFTE